MICERNLFNFGCDLSEKTYEWKLNYSSVNYEKGDINMIILNRQGVAEGEKTITWTNIFLSFVSNLSERLICSRWRCERKLIPSQYKNTYLISSLLFESIHFLYFIHVRTIRIISELFVYILFTHITLLLSFHPMIYCTLS